MTENEMIASVSEMETEGAALLPERKHRIVTVPGHGELSPEQEEQMAAFIEYIFEKRKEPER